MSLLSFGNCAYIKELCSLLQLHLQTTAYLAGHAWARKLMCFKLRPKSHYLWHLAVGTRRYRLNPRLFHTWDDESFLGKMKGVARRCHGRAVERRVLQRYVVNLAGALDDL